MNKDVTCYDLIDAFFSLRYSRRVLRLFVCVTTYDERF